MRFYTLLPTLILYSFITQYSFADSGTWEYQGKTGPGNWGNLKDEFSECATGKMQSPININYATDNKDNTLKLNYHETNLNIENNGHTIQVNYGRGSNLVLHGENYKLVQFHFHTPSEHQINGKSYDMELHFVHQNEVGELAVVAVMIKPGKENLTFQKIIEHTPDFSGSNKQYKTVSVNAENLLPHGKSYYEFKGSLTIPPCSEGVKWHVFKDPIEVSEEQIKSFKAIYNKNNRPLQPPNARWITTRS